MSKRIQKFSSFSHRSNHEYAKKHGKTLSSVVDSRRKFGERHILRDGPRLPRGVGNKKASMGPPKLGN